MTEEEEEEERRKVWRRKEAINKEKETMRKKKESERVGGDKREKERHNRRGSKTGMEGAEGGMKSLRDIQLETLARSMMIEARPKREEEKFGDDGRINYQAFKNRFKSVTRVEGMNSLDALAEILYWLKGGPKRIAEAYMGAADPKKALADLWKKLDAFYTFRSLTPMERIAPIVENKSAVGKEDLDAHIELMADLKAAKREAQDLSVDDQLDNADVIREVVKRRYKYRADRLYETEAVRRRTDEEYRLTFKDIILDVSERAQVLKSQGVMSRMSTQVRMAPMATTEVTRQQPTLARRCHLCQTAHSMDRCNRLAKMTIEKRVEYLRRERICFRCFEKDHRAKDCKSGIMPQCNECEYKHHSIMHGYHLVRLNINGESIRDNGTGSSNNENGATGSGTGTSQVSGSSNGGNTSGGRISGSGTNSGAAANRQSTA